MTIDMSPTEVLVLAFAAGVGWYAAYLLFCIVEDFLTGDDE